MQVISICRKKKRGVCAYTHIYVVRDVCEMCVCVWIYIFLETDMCMETHMYVYLHLHMCTHVHMCVYTQTHVHTHICKWEMSMCVRYLTTRMGCGVLTKMGGCTHPNCSANSRFLHRHNACQLLFNQPQYVHL